MSKTRKILIAVIAVVVLGIGGVYGYLVFIKDDAPPALSASDLDAALDDTTPDSITPVATTDSALITTPETASDPAPPATTEAASPTSVPSPDDAVSGVWNISQDSTLGYRVQEVLGGIDTEGAGRTNQVTGTLTIDGTVATTAEFTVDMASITSDSDRRDGQFRGRIMTVDQFPTSTFVLTQPIDFGAVPAEGETITATATGDLTLRGVTNSVTFEIQAELRNGRIGILGSISILFSDYDIPDPTNAVATVKDNGLLEFVLVFDKA
jgi:polyisoprenoid-binding protein YceI